MRVASRVVLSVGTVAAHILVSVRLASGPAPEPRGTMVPVVVATRDIAEGDRLYSGSVGVVYWPAGTVPRGAYGSMNEVIGRMAGTAVFKGEVIIPRRIAGTEGANPGLPKITPGKRAMSFMIDEASGAAGIIHPNSRVDLLLVFDRESGKKAKFVMENMRVLAVGSVPTQWVDRSRVDPAWIATIEVTPEEGERLALMTGQGRIQLVLRSPDARDFAPDVSLGSVIKKPTPPDSVAVVAPRRPVPPSIQERPLVSHAVILR